MTNPAADTDKQIVRAFIGAVWERRDLASLATFWTEDCVNHALPGPNNRGLVVLRAYHEQFFATFDAFSNVRIEIVQQVAEADRVVTQLTTRGEHSGPFSGIAATGRAVSLAAIRIDRLEDGKIAEHWSIADLAGCMQQLQG